MIQISKGDYLKIKKLLSYIVNVCGVDKKGREMARQASLLLKKYNRREEKDEI